MERRRPTGVTIISALAIIAGLLLIFGGISLVAFAPFIGHINLNNGINTSNTSFSLNVNGTVVTIPKNPLFVLGGFIGILGATLIVLGIADFVVAWGLLKGKGMGVDTYNYNKHCFCGPQYNIHSSGKYRKHMGSDNKWNYYLLPLSPKRKILFWQNKSHNSIISYPLKFMVLCVPSQKGLFSEAPQRQSV